MADLSARYPQHRAKLLGLHQTAFTVAFTVGPAVGGWMADVYGFMPSFFGVAAACCLTSLG